MPPEETLWTLEPHTAGKHEVLREYLDAWLPILAQSQFGAMTIVDGFAGPGRYSRGEDGSPIIALKAAAEHSQKKVIERKLQFVFIESDERRYRELEANIHTYLLALPRRAVSTYQGEFDDVANRVLDQADKDEFELGPSFFMIDPFGIKGVRMETVRRILSKQSAEVYISFQFEPFERFKEHPYFEAHLDQLFGCGDWRKLTQHTDYLQMKENIYDLFIKQLKEAAGANHVLQFELYEGENNLKYTLFFATGNELGCNRMKQAIWKVDPDGDYAFRGGKLGQIRLGIETDTEPLKQDLINRFKDRGWISIEQLESFVKSDATPFHSGHLKQKTLQPMEREGLIRVQRPPGQGGFRPGTKIKFLDKPVDTAPSDVQIGLMS